MIFEFIQIIQQEFQTILSGIRKWRKQNVFLRIYLAHYKFQWMALIFSCFALDVLQALPILSCIILWCQIIFCFLAKGIMTGVDYTEVVFTIQHVLGHMCAHALFAIASFMLYNNVSGRIPQLVRSLQNWNTMLNKKEHKYAQDTFAARKEAVKESFPFPGMHNLLCEYIKPEKNGIYRVTPFERFLFRALYFIIYVLLGYYVLSNSGDFLGQTLEKVFPHDYSVNETLLQEKLLQLEKAQQELAYLQEQKQLYEYLNQMKEAIQSDFLSSCS